MDQVHYIKALIKKYKMEDAEVSTTPMHPTVNLEAATEEEALEFKKSGYDYRAAIGSLN